MIAMLVIVTALVLMGRCAMNRARQGWTPEMPMWAGVGMAVDMATVAMGQRLLHGLNDALSWLMPEPPCPGWRRARGLAAKSAQPR